MKLNWFSPLPPAKTEIAHYTTRILPALRERAEIVVWTDQTTWSPILEDYAEVLCFQPDRIPWTDMNRADMSIYHIGNHPLFHGKIWQASRRHPGIIVLHDFRLQHLFAGLYRDQWADREGYVTEMERHYGETGRLAGGSFWDRQYSTEAMAEKYPLTSLAIENSLGVLVHTGEAFDQLTKARPWPLAHAPLPYPVSPRLAPNDLEASGSRVWSPPYRLIVFGHLGLNRRVDVLLQALGEFPGRDRFRLDIYGHLWDSDYVRGVIQSFGLEELVALHDFVPEAELDAALASAHLAINLRYPTMGEASAAQLRIWDHALPSLVTSVGWYATLPDDAVLFVRPEHEITDIHHHLQTLLDHPAHFVATGEHGRRLLEERHAPDSYVQAIMELAVCAGRYRSNIHARAVARHVGDEMRAWASPALSGGLFDKVGSEVFTIMVTPEEEPSPAALRDTPRDEHYALFSNIVRENLKALQRNWNAFGWTDPFGAVLASPQERPSTSDCAEYLRTGQEEVSCLMRYVASIETDMSRGRALDFGCRVGRVTQALSRYFEECIGIDNDRSMIALANQYNHMGSRCNFVFDASNDLKSLADDSLDFIYANLVFQHMEPEFRKHVIKAFIRILAPGGLAVFQLPSERIPVENQCAFDQGAIREPMPRSGLMAAITLGNAPIALAIGSRSVLRVRVRNSSDRTWPAFGLDDGTYQIRLGNRWLDEGGNVVVSSDGRATLPKDLKPMHLIEVPLVVTTPKAPGRYILELDMVQEGVTWFKDRGSKPLGVRVTVGRVVDRLAGICRKCMGHSRFGGHPGECPPASEVHAMRKKDAIDFIKTHGARIVDMQENDLAGKGWRAFHYCVTKD